MIMIIFFFQVSSLSTCILSIFWWGLDWMIYYFNFYFDPSILSKKLWIYGWRKKQISWEFIKLTPPQMIKKDPCSHQLLWPLLPLFILLNYIQIANCIVNGYLLIIQKAQGNLFSISNKLGNVLLYLKDSSTNHVEEHIFTHRTYIDKV